MEQAERCNVEVSLSSASVSPLRGCSECTDWTRNLLMACEAIKWPMKVDYPTLGAQQRRNFERAYMDLLYLQAE